MGLNSFDYDEVYGKCKGQEEEDSEEAEYLRITGSPYDQLAYAKSLRDTEQDEDGEARQWVMLERTCQEDLKRHRLSKAVGTENPTGKEHSKIIGMAPHPLSQADKVARGKVKPADKGIDSERIWELHKEGFTYKEIGKRLGVCESTIKKKMRKIKATGKLAWPEGKVFMVFEGCWK